MFPTSAKVNWNEFIRYHNEIFAGYLMENGYEKTLISSDQGTIELRKAIEKNLMIFDKNLLKKKKCNIFWFYSLESQWDACLGLSPVQRSFTNRLPTRTTCRFSWKYNSSNNWFKNGGNILVDCLEKRGKIRRHVQSCRGQVNDFLQSKRSCSLRGQRSHSRLLWLIQI